MRTHIRGRPKHRPIRQWDAEDWRTFYDERAAIAEYDGNQTRHRAEALSFETTAVEWMNATSPAGLSEVRCAGCDEPLGTIGDDAVPVLAGGGAHAWVHHGDCHKHFMAARKAEAVKVLGAMGIDGHGRIPSGPRTQKERTS